MNLPPVGCMLFAQALLQGSQVLLALLINSASRFRNLLMKFLRSGAKVLAHSADDFFRETLSLLLDLLQFLCHVLPKLILRFTYLLADSFFCCLKHLL